jgi:hypothetical protein
MEVDMSIEYEKQVIHVYGVNGEMYVTEAMVGVGTGLAYHQLVSGKGVYALTHVQSGYGIGELTLPTEAEIQAFLERVAALRRDRWQVDLVQLKRSSWSRLRAQIELAHFEVRSPYSIFLYAEYAYGDPIPESYDAVADPQAAFNLALVSHIFSTHDYEAHNFLMIRVRLVRMDERTGIHETLHVYERDQMASCGK